MSWPYGLTTASFTFLVPRAPTITELQAALDAQDFLGRLVISPLEPVEVPSDTPPLYEWRGRLDGKDVAFRIGKVPPAKLPGTAKEDPGVRSWALALWSTDSGQADVVGAGAMALHAWAVATHGVAYSSNRGAVSDLRGSQQAIDFILTCNSLRWDAFRARYPDYPPDDSPKPGQPLEIIIRVH